MAQQCFEKVLKSLPESKVKGLELRFRPLGVSDEPACSVVETAFENPDHRCTPEKVGVISCMDMVPISDTVFMSHIYTK